MNIDKTLIFSCLSASLLAACMPLTPNLDSSFGNAVNQAKAQQTLNPDASRNTDPVTGIDGKAGQAVVERYYEGMKQEPAPATVINIGGGLGGS